MVIGMLPAIGVTLFYSFKGGSNTLRYAADVACVGVAALQMFKEEKTFDIFVGAQGKTQGMLARNTEHWKPSYCLFTRKPHASNYVALPMGQGTHFLPNSIAVD